MRLRNYVYYFPVLLLIGTGCKVSPPTASQKQTIPADTVLINVHEVESDVIEIEAHPSYPSSISILGVGDMMLGTNFPDEKYLPPDSGKYILEGVKHILSSTDLTFGNLEGVILNQGGDPKECRNPELCYLFRSPEYIALRLMEAGFDVVSTANNHAGDFGEPGRLNTARVLDSLGIAHAGSIEKPYTIFIRKKIKFGFAAFAPNKGTPSIGDYKAAKATVHYLDSICDVVIVSFHGGAEGKDFQHVTREDEYFYGESRGNIYKFSHELIDTGADIVFGHGPHIPRAIEVYNDRFVAYSLGNFCTYARFNLRGINAYAPMINVFVDHQGRFQRGQIISAIQTGLGIPVLDDKHRAARLISTLTREDFEEAKIVIEDSGVITYIENYIEN